MPKFLNVHSLKDFDKSLRKAQNSPKDEFGVTHYNIMYNKEEDKFFFCLLDAPNKEAIVKHHEKYVSNMTGLHRLRQLLDGT